jgi:hypothetical protein
MKREFLPPILIAAIVIFPALFCGGDLQNPWTDPASSVIRDDRSLTTLPAAVNEFQEYPCSLYVLLPGLSDSIRVVMLATGGDIVLWQLDSLSAADTATSLSLSFPAGAQSPLRVYLYRKNGTIDSLVKNIVVLHQASVTLTGLPSAINENQEYPCSLYVFLPALSDSLAVMIRVSGGDRVLWWLSPLSAADTATSLSLYFPTGVQSPLRVYLYRKNGTIDSLVKAVVVRHPPSASPDAERYSTYVNVPAHPVFSLTDPDGDIRSCQIWIDSTTGQAIVPQLTWVSATLATVTCAVSSPSFDSMIVFAQALDSAGNASAVAQCMVFVADTAKPVLTLLNITPSTGDTMVRTLPCTIEVRLQDDSPIDSARFADSAGLSVQQMTITGDTASAVIATLDSGMHVYRVTAWDRAGNAGTLVIPIKYTGNVLYKFTISGISDRTINENGTLPSINLNNSVTIAPNPGISTWKDSIQWQVLETKPGIGIVATLNPATKVVSFAVPDSEWSGVESFTFLANWPDMAMGNAGATYTINPINDPPVITLKAINKIAKRSFDTIWADTCVRDPDHKPSTISWTQDTTRGKIYTLQWISRLGIIGEPAAAPPAMIDGGILIDLWTRKWNVVTKNPKSMFIVGSTYTDTLRLIARDGANAVDSQNVIIKAMY